MIRIWKILLTLALLPLLARAQQVPNMDNYRPARSNGPLPKDFLTSTIEKYEKDKGKIDQGQDKNMQKAEEDFYLQTNYSVDQMRFSGDVLVNDTMGIYVNRVADSLLLKQDPELRAKLSFYIMRSPIVNAFTTDQGAIFVTVGLLTRLHNEAELAYVLAHEVIHFKRHHVLTGYVESVKAKEGLGKYEATTFENRFLKRHRYARSQEAQADEEGFELLVNSNYDPHAAIAAFDILALADAPFSDTLFTKHFFETDFLLFPSRYQPDTVKAIRPQDEDEDDDLATHPSVYKRRKSMVRKFSKLSPADTTGANFLVSESLFWRIKAIARFEECAEHSASGNYGEAIYSNYAEQKYYPHNYYLEKEMVRAMYIATIRKNRYNDLAALFETLFSGVSIGTSDDEKPVGEQGRLNAFVDKTDASGWNIAALSYAWEVHKRYPDDADITLWCNGLFRELAVKNDIRMNDFMKDDSLFLLIGTKAMVDTAIARKVKSDTPAGRFQAGIDYLKRDSLNAWMNDSSKYFHYWRFAFINQLHDSDFVRMFRGAIAYSDSLDRTDSLYDELSRRERKKIDDAEYNDPRGPQGMKRVVAVNPVFMAYDYRMENSDIDVRASLAGHDQLIREMENSSKLVGLQLRFLNSDSLDTASVDRFNDLMVASNWFDQRSDFGDNQILPYPQQDMQALAQKYGTQYFMWSAYITYKEKRAGNIFNAIGLALTPVAPQLVCRLFTPRESVYFIAIIYDVNTGKPVFMQRTEMSNQRATDDRMRLHVFDLMRLLAQPKKASK
jgi:hypothetical protein